MSVTINIDYNQLHISSIVEYAISRIVVFYIYVLKLHCNYWSLIKKIDSIKFWKINQDESEHNIDLANPNL